MIELSQIGCSFIEIFGAPKSKNIVGGGLPTGYLDYWLNPTLSRCIRINDD